MEIIKLNLIPSGVNPTCHAKQYDKGRIIRFELFNGLTPYTLQSGDTVTLNLRKPDNTIIETSVTATQGNKYVDLVTTEQMCAVAGYNLGCFKIVNGEDDIGTLNFIMAVERDVLADGVPSQSQIDDLAALVAEAVEADLGDNYYTKTQTDSRISELIDDTEASADKTYSSDKIEGELAPINKQLDFVEKDIKTLYSGNDVFVGGTIDATTGDLNAAYAPYYKATDYINISGFKSLNYWSDILTSSQIFGGAFYDDNKVFISGVKFNIAAVASHENRLVSVPDNAVYFRTCCRIAEVGDFFVTTNTFRKLEKEINDINTELSNYALQLFEKVGVIGDSISCGWAKDKNNSNSRRNTGISWVQQLARRLGCTAYNLGASGVDPVTWFKPDFESAQYCYQQYQSVGFCDLYIIGLGLNGGTLGTIADVNQNDYTQNAETFYGQYARIIQMINAEHPNAIVVCLTEPTPMITGYDQAVRYICALEYINAQLLDLEKDYYEWFNTPEIRAELQPDGLHYTPYGYSLIARAMAFALSDCIRKNPSAFKYVGVANV